MPPAATARSRERSRLAPRRTGRHAARWRRLAFLRAPWPPRPIVAPALRRGVVPRLVARDVWRAGPDACWRRFDVVLDALERRAPASGFWLGERPSVADLGLFAQLHSLRTPLTPWQCERVQARARLAAYLDRVDLATR